MNEEIMLNRRGFLSRMTGLVVAGSGVGRFWALLPNQSLTGTPITVYKSKSCGCCAKWVDYMREAGFDPTVYDEEDMEGIKNSLGVPAELRSCHTAVLDRYLIEGHVPAPDIQRLLSLKSKLNGLAVPGMPPGTPGMAPAGAALRNFKVVGFSSGGSRSTFATY
jgi:hypothetical protein